jgi:hypothetical protein
MTDPRPPRAPDDLARLIASDLQPVRPAPMPWRRAVRWLPAALVAMAALPLLTRIRLDAPVLGAAMTWGLSTMQVVAAGVLVWMAARDGMPARRLPRSFFVWAAAGAIALIAILTMATFAVSPTTLSEATAPFRAGSFCYRGSLTVGAPLLLLAGLILRHTLPAQPWVVGAVAGAGAGLAADAGWRLVCPISDPAHVFFGHTPAVVTMTLAGAALAAVLSTRRRR